MSESTSGRKPEWLKVNVPAGENWRRLSELVERKGLATVCDSARCPNKAECWDQSTATFMVLGSVCTRGCRFCAVGRARAGESVRADEPERLADAIAELGLRYAVITSVDRDDLPDRGAGHFAACVRAIKARDAGVLVEVLIPDYRESEITGILDAAPDVVAHNVETVARLQNLRDVRASMAASLHTLYIAAERSRHAGGKPAVKSSLILGLGETDDEIVATMRELRAVGCTHLVMGQYLRPTRAQIEVARYLTPEEFAELGRTALSLGFVSVVSEPLARTSYHARQAFDAPAPEGA